MDDQYQIILYDETENKYQIKLYLGDGNTDISYFQALDVIFKREESRHVTKNGILDLARRFQMRGIGNGVQVFQIFKDYKKLIRIGL